MYVRSQPTASDRAKAAAAFARHCGGVTAASQPSTGQHSLARPTAWPLPATLSALLVDSRHAAMGLEAALLEGCVAEVAAAQAADAAAGVLWRFQTCP